jgi:hypothetical protein
LVTGLSTAMPFPAPGIALAEPAVAKIAVAAAAAIRNLRIDFLLKMDWRFVASLAEGQLRAH